ncbi:Protein RER1B isoform E [Glycine soja]|uniref:Protein RER1B isoform D n=1 Tax=Glycine soja TaxID=3848 RepID=A0A445K392_GLYSO|nr:Protein RER1B isoform D [Glycine soja]RZC05227.1 Protein RER1B isoform E [Glycine soja]
MEGSGGGGASPSAPVKQYLHDFSKLFQYYLDKSTPHSTYRWIGTFVIASIYVLRVVYVQGFYIVSYGLGIYLLNLLIGFLSPLVDPELDPSDSPLLPTKGSDEFKPFIRRLPEFKFWSTMEAIYLLRRVMEQYRMAQQDLHLIFIDLEKAYDRVPREILWKALDKKGVRVAYIRAIQDMYDRVSTSVRTQGGESDDFPITIGLHQGSTLSLYLFTLILDVLTEQIQEIAPRCMLFADDIVLLGESREELNERLETWRRALETHGFRLSRSKSEYMECKFNKRMRVSNSEVKIGDHIIPQVTRFKYLGSVIQDDGEIEGDVNHRIQAGWMKWRKASGVLCDAKVPIKLKGKFYRTAVRPAILYGTECWTVKSQHENKVGVTEMRMLRWMCGKTRQDKIRNEAIRERVGVAPIVEKMVENRLRYSFTKALCIAFVMTFFSLFDVPVFWPILLCYWFVLFVLTMRRQVAHMIKYKYIPFNLGKQKYSGNKSSARSSSSRAD